MLQQAATEVDPTLPMARVTILQKRKDVRLLHGSKRLKTVANDSTPTIGQNRATVSSSPYVSLAVKP